MGPSFMTSENFKIFLCTFQTSVASLDKFLDALALAGMKQFEDRQHLVDAAGS